MTFETLGLSPRLVARLTALGMTRPTPIQDKAIPHVLNGRDVLGLAQTGTGKTAAFGLPILQGVIGAERAAPKTAHALVLAPTRELAMQIMDALQGLAAGKDRPRIGLVVGGRSLFAQSQMLQKGTEILVATPGRLIDLLDRKAVRLNETRFLVLDEADQMLDLGFIHALRRIAPLLPKERQTMLFSATMPKLMEDLSRAYLSNPIRVEVAPPGKPADKVAQSVHFVAKEGKQALLIDLLDAHRNERALVFARTKHGAEKLMTQLDRAGFATSSIHGNKSQGQRTRALTEFREGKIRVLVATDVAARGIDIPGVEYVYNFELPNVPENYVHRIGRTARAGAEGRAVALCAADEMGDLKAIEKVLGQKVPVAGGEPWAGRGGEKKADKKPFRPHRRPGKRPAPRRAA